MPIRTAGAPLNYARLTQRPPADYRLGAGDVLEVTVAQLFEQGREIRPLRVQVMSSGEIQLPQANAVQVAGLNLLEAQRAIVRAYKIAKQFVDPNVNVALAEKATHSVLVLGAVVTPGVHALPKYENDVGHALAAAGGFNDDAGDVIEVHQRIGGTAPASPPGNGAAAGPPCAVIALTSFSVPAAIAPPPVPQSVQAVADESMRRIRIPMRGLAGELAPQQIVLNAGDVVVVPNRRNDVFFVVGKLAASNFVRFTVRERERELGTGFILPKDREVDAVTAVAMAGYIDPIDSPTTVTVHRVMPDGKPLLILVDLIKARYDRRETVFIQPGDIVYLNPDGAWWFRRTFDRWVDDVFRLPYNAATFNRWIP